MAIMNILYAAIAIDSSMDIIASAAPPNRFSVIFFTAQIIMITDKTTDTTRRGVPAVCHRAILYDGKELVHKLIAVLIISSADIP